MTDDASQTGALAPDSAVGPFVIGALVGATASEGLYTASEARLDRMVLVRVAMPATAAALAADARRVAAVTHPNLVPVLAASTFEGGAYAATPDLAARPLRELVATRRLTSVQAIRVARGVAAATEALAAAGIRVPIDLDTVMVAGDGDGERGLLDPLRAPADAGSRLSEPDLATSTRELADVLEQVVQAPSDAVRSAIGEARSGALERPADLAGALGPVPVPRPARRFRLLAAAAAIAVAALVAVIALLISSRGGGRPRSAVAPPGARVLARIPLGLTGKEEAAAFAISGHTVWVTTSQGRLLRIDARTNELVGAGGVLDAHKAFLNGIAVANGSLWVTDASKLLRVSPVTGRVLSSVDVSGADQRFMPVAARSAGGMLWLPGTVLATGNPFGTGAMLRFDPAGMRVIGKRMPAELLPYVSSASGRYGYVQGLISGVVTRFDARSGKGVSLAVDPAPSALAVGGDTLWSADAGEGILTPIDARTMRFTRDAVPTDGFPGAVMTHGADVWVATSASQRGAGAQSLERIDAATGRRAGRLVPIGSTRTVALEFGLGSIWALSTDGLVRLAPTAPRPSLVAAHRATGTPRPVQTGPLAAGAWKAGVFAAPFTFSMPSYSWFAELPQPDAFSLVAARDTDEAFSVIAPQRVYVTDTQIVRAGTPAQLLAHMRKNPHLALGPVRKVTFDGRPALEFDLATRHAPANYGSCGPTPCVSLFPVTGGGVDLNAGTSGPALLFSVGGHTVVLLEQSKNGDSRGLAEVAARVATIHFATT